MPGGAALNLIASGPWPSRSLMTAFWPPIGLAEPCSRLATVSPPASWRRISGDSELTTSPIETIADEGRVPSLTEPRIMLWLWASMRPGVICLPLASITCAFSGGFRLRPICLILPSTTSRSCFLSTPRLLLVQSVALRTSTASGSSKLSSPTGERAKRLSGLFSSSSGSSFSSFFFLSIHASFSGSKVCQRPSIQTPFILASGSK